MGGIVAVAGAKLYIGSALSAKSSNFVLTDFNGQSWVNLSWLENLGQFGDEWSEITFSSISDIRTQKLKGVKNAGNMALVLGVDYTDEGQQILRAAEETIYDYAWRVQINDQPAGGVAPSYRYFIGKVMSAREQFDTVNNVVRLNASIGINSNIVITNAH